MQIAKIRFEICPVVRPRHAVHPRRGLRADRPIRRPQAIDIDVVQERGEPHILVLPRRSAHDSQITWRAGSGPESGARFPGRVSLGRSPSLHRLRRPTLALFTGFAGTTEPSDFPRSSITGLRPQPCPHDPPNHHHKRVTMGSPGSRTWRFRACTGSWTPRGPPTARESAAGDVAFRLL